MRCGEKCFHVKIEQDGKQLIKSINARTPAEARKTIRQEYGLSASVISVRKWKNNR
ncbi:hypothetical protein NSQ77_06560 [Oceanobacillus sp. FSL K6-2867]|uniref:hypothetical protein n=1 Tax=Oceanobacillus sp. FSL K6-2867 TaxID=2954748 RepID=UPI0030DAF79E